MQPHKPIFVGTKEYDMIIGKGWNPTKKQAKDLGIMDGDEVNVGVKDIGTGAIRATHAYVMGAYAGAIVVRRDRVYSNWKQKVEKTN